MGAEHGTSAGSCELPIRYFDGSLIGLLWRIDLRRVAPLLDGRPVEPLPVFGKAVALLCAMDYRETSIGPYGELGIAVYVRRRGTRPSGLRTLWSPTREEHGALWVLNLPVTTDTARVAGIELWGYPKYLSFMEQRFHADGVEVRLGAELEVHLGRSGWLSSVGIPFVTFTQRDGALLRTETRVDYPVRWGGARAGGVRVLGEGPSAETVRALGLDRQPPSFAFRGDAFRAVLPAGRVVAHC